MGSNEIDKNSFRKDLADGDLEEGATAAPSSLAQTGPLEQVRVGISGPDGFRRDTLSRFGLPSNITNTNLRLVGNMCFKIHERETSEDEGENDHVTINPAGPTYHNDMGAVELIENGKVQTISGCIDDILRGPSGGRV